jgi:NAD(P)H-flavin reductase
MAVLQPRLGPELASAPGPMVPVPFTVRETRQDTEDVWTLWLESNTGEPFEFEPGQFTMLSASGAGEVPISISGDADRPGRLMQTIRAVGLATQAICAAQPGQVLSVRGPFGSSWPVDAAAGADVVVAVGGLGLPPLRGAILRLLAHRERYGRLVLLYGARTPDQLLFTDELEEWKARGLEVLVTVDAAGPEWLGPVGVVTRLIARAAIHSDNLVALSCGPEVMMRFVVAGLAERGLRPERTYVSMERNMQCGIGHCGHCQLGPTLVCRDGPVYKWSDVGPWLAIREL